MADQQATTERAYWLAWSHIDQVGPIIQKRLWEGFGSLGAAWQAKAGALLEIDGIGLLTAEEIVSQRRKLNPSQLLADHEVKNTAFWTPADADYPALLFAIVDPPPVLYFRGPYRPNDYLDRLSVGMVGTRSPSAYGKRWTARLSQALAQAGAVVVSGLAAGIDAIAHQTCLEQTGATIAVLGTGVDQVYPARNRSLYQDIAQRGLLVSEYPDGTGPDRAHFPRRNRVIAGLSQATLVTEAPARSGALITARLANDYGREVFALPSSLENERGSGCLKLIAQGAQVVLSEQDWIETLKSLPAVAWDWPGKASWTEQRTPPVGGGVQVVPRDRPEPQASAEGPAERAIAALPFPETAALQPSTAALAPTLQTVLSAIGPEPQSLDQVVLGSHLDTGAVLAALVQLELGGWVEQLPGMQYQRTSVA